MRDVPALGADPSAGPSAPPPDGTALAAALRRQARRLGFAAVGWVQARRLEFLERWLHARHEQGCYPAFCERDPALRADPERWLAGARTVIVAALPYQPPASASGRGRPIGPSATLAAYALPPDYHREMRRRLGVLVGWLARRFHVDRDREFRILVDTGPPVERELLRLSGAGWIGKNTCAFVPGAGSWVTLGTVVTTLELPGAAIPDPGPPAPAEACLGCDRCLRACPTGALRPYEMDPRACIAEWTQLRGPLPEPQRERLGSWVFGCDICQAVCPHNRPDRAPLAYFSPGRLRPSGALKCRMPLTQLLDLDTPAFERDFGPCAASWRGKNVLQRNAAYVARRWLTRGHEPPGLASRLQRLAREHPSPVVRDASRWALEGRPSPPAPSPLTLGPRGPRDGRLQP